MQQFKKTGDYQKKACNIQIRKQPFNYQKPNSMNDIDDRS